VTDTLEYQTINDVLERAELELDASQAHGLVCGLICGDFPSSLQHLNHELMGDMDENDSLTQECRRTLTQLHGITKDLMDDVEMRFHLLLPDDPEDMPARAKGIVDWCQGFLFGYGINAGEQHQHLSNDALGALEDISEFTRMDLAEFEHLDEEDQESLQDLEEYLRMATLMIYGDIAAHQEEPENDEELH
jgi:uncharacterized protein YgfB (UPF0149 family)